MEATFSGDSMSSSDGRIFADDWRDTLREQYKYVIQQGDTRTEETLTQVLHEVGFTDDDLAALRLEATMRAEDMPDDYVPDEVKQSFAGVDVPAEEAVTDRVAAEDEADDIAIEEEPATYDELVEMAEELPDEDADELDNADDPAPEDDEDSAQQMSMF